jgi:TonB-dependent receptor
MSRARRPASLVPLILALAFHGAHAYAQPAPSPPADPAPPSPPAQDEEGEEDLPADEPEPAPGEPAPKEEAPGEDELSDEELLAGEENADRPPPAGKGVIWGTIKETEFKEPLVEAPVQVVGTKTQVLTDLEGRFRLELPPGTYDIRISYELHKTARFDGVVVEAGKSVRLDVDLVADKDAIDVFEVVEEADKSSLEGLILARQKSTVVGDSIGRSEISKTTDRNAAQAAQRVVGATVVGGRFVYVRGLGERYTNALLNGVPLPSPEPDRAAVPLDMFPTGVLNSLTIAKTFTPDSPGDFAGGSVRIETREIPREPLFQVSARGGYNTNSTFRERLTYRGGDLDFLGIDDGTRALPDGFPTGFADNLPPDQRTQAGRDLNSYMSATRGGTPPEFGVGVVAGNGWDFGNDRKLGGLLAVNYGQTFTVRRDEILRIYTPPQPGEKDFHVARDYRAETGNVATSWGAYGSLTYRFDAQHQLTLTGLRTTLNDNRTQYITGFHDLREANIHATRLGFTTRALNMLMLNGEHRFPELDSAELDWNVTYSVATRDEPDRRDAVWSDSTATPEKTYVFVDAYESGRHFFSDQSETQAGGGLDWTQPLDEKDNKLKGGGLVSLRDREFNSRALTLGTRSGATPINQPVLSCPSADLDACNDSLFVPSNIGSTDENALELREFRGNGDNYDATLNIYSAYIMADLGVAKDVRVVVGERIEHTLQQIDAYDTSLELDPDLGARISQTDWLPSLAVAWSMNPKSKLRGSATRTLARPQLRELAPFTFQDYFGGRVEGGNPDLQITNITNLDARLEYFPTLREVLALSVFFKDFKNPIERVIIASGDEGAVSYRNADSAQLLGIELEARKDLAFASPALADFSFTTNLTVAHSRITVPDEDILGLTNLTRPLVNQAPWVFNFSLTYTREQSGTTATALYNVVGPRIAYAGSMGLDDVYEHPRNLIDLTVQQKLGKHFALKGEAKNILNAPVMYTQGCNKESGGSTWHFSCDRGKESATSYYTEGATFAITASYEM